MVSRTTRGAAGDAVEATVVGEMQALDDLGAADVQDLLFMEKTPPNSNQADKYISISKSQLLSAIDSNGKLHIGVADEPDHGRSLLNKVVAGVRAPRLAKPAQP